MVRGYQGDGLDDPTAILATAKHFAGLLRDAGRARRQRGRHLAAQAALVVPAARSSAWPARAAARSCSATRRWTACRSPSTTGCSTTCCAASGATPAPSSPTGTTSAAWCGSSSIAARLRARRRAAAVKAGNDMVMTTPGFFAGRTGGRRAGACSTRPQLDAAVAPHPHAEVRARTLRGPAPARRRAPARASSAPPSTPTLNLEVARRSLVLLDATTALLPARRRGVGARTRSPSSAPTPTTRRPSSATGPARPGQADWLPDGHPREHDHDRARRPRAQVARRLDRHVRPRRRHPHARRRPRGRVLPRRPAAPAGRASRRRPTRR